MGIARVPVPVPPPIVRAPRGDDPGWEHRHLQREVCLRCAKRLGREPVLECVFPATHTKCTRCTRLKDKCVPVSDPSSHRVVSESPGSC